MTLFLTPTQREAMYPPDVVEAWHWVKIYANHRAKLNSDQQTYDGLTEEMAKQLDKHLETLRQHDLVIDAVYQPKLKPGMLSRRPNFIVVDLGEKASMFYSKCKECHK